jgi:hypothetical protein
VQPPASIIDDHAVDPFLARVTLDRLRARSRDALYGAVAAAVFGALLLITGDLTVGFAAMAGALAGGVVFGYARSDRSALVARLVHQRSAYEIDEVADAAAALVTTAQRERVARTLGRLVLEADGFAPSSLSYLALYDRVREFRSDFIAVAFHLARPTSRIHPTAMALLTRMLTQAQFSPLYNDALPASHLRVALMRVQASISG